MMQDRALKAQILKYSIGKRWFPQLEVDVIPRAATAEARRHLTDIDVLISMPDEFDGYRTLFVDCTTRKDSPITRALWLRGLMDQLGATRGLCVVGKDKIEPDHRYNAAQLGVVLLTEDDLAKYTAATGERVNSTRSHLADIELWERFFAVGEKYRALNQTIEFSTSGYWMIRNDSEACRKTIAEAVRIRPEVDPAKAEHVALVFDLAALFMHSLAKIVAKIFASYLQPENRDDLSEALLTFLYGGRDNYEHLNSLKKLIGASQSGAQNGRPLKLPEWDLFLQLVRHGLDSPTEFPYAALLLREIAWGYLAEKQDLTFATTLAREKRQAAKIALLGAEYISQAGKLPPEFGSAVGKLILDIQQPPNTFH
jgi:hypothetical protein